MSAPATDKIPGADQPGDGPRSIPVTLAVYRDLRVGMVVIMVMLAAAVVIEQLSAACWQSAISAYYYTSAHSIVIASLVALGALFIMYKGSSDTEDTLLTLAGVSALVAALVPQGRPVPACAPYLPPDYKVEAAIRPNVWAMAIALLLGWSLALWQSRRNRTRVTKSPGGTLALCFFWLVMVAGLTAFIFDYQRFYEYAHGAAGLLMLSSFILTAFCTAYLAGREEDNPYRLFYRIIAVVMVVTLIAVVASHLAHKGWELWVLVIEAALILEFAAYWVIQTIELWNTPDRSERLSEEDRNRLAQRPTTGGLTGFKSGLTDARNQPRGEKLLPFL
jgi:hypothetical protein